MNSPDEPMNMIRDIPSSESTNAYNLLTKMDFPKVDVKTSTSVHVH